MYQMQEDLKVAAKLHMAQVVIQAQRTQIVFAPIVERTITLWRIATGNMVFLQILVKMLVQVDNVDAKIFKGTNSLILLKINMRSW
jgi:hypothetical protein